MIVLVKTVLFYSLSIYKRLVVKCIIFQQNITIVKSIFIQAYTVWVGSGHCWTLSTVYTKFFQQANLNTLNIRNIATNIFFICHTLSKGSIFVLIKNIRALKDKKYFLK